jgi:hypothetical protein
MRSNVAFEYPVPINRSAFVFKLHVPKDKIDSFPLALSQWPGAVYLVAASRRFHSQKGVTKSPQNQDHPLLLFQSINGYSYV